MTTTGFNPDRLLSGINSKAEVKRPFAFPSNSTLVPKMVDGDVGLELEIEASTPFPSDGFITVQGKRSGARWNAITDGSLRGHAREFVLTTAAYLDELPELLNGLFSALEKHNVRIDNSNRCSTHVHVNMADKKINHLTSTILLWSIFESAIIRWCGEERVANHFCLSMKDATSVTSTWLSVLRGSNLNVVYGNNNLKYSALNIRPFPDRGSFEFRCGRGSDNAQYPLQYAYLVKAIVDEACGSYENPLLIANHLSEQGAASILQTVFNRYPSVLTTGLLSDIVGSNVEQFDSEALVNFRNVQALAYSHDWFSLLSEINRPFVPDPFKVKKRFSGSEVTMDEVLRGATWETSPSGPVRRTEEHVFISAPSGRSRATRATAPAPRSHAENPDLAPNELLLVVENGHRYYNMPPLVTGDDAGSRPRAAARPAGAPDRWHMEYFLWSELVEQGYFAEGDEPPSRVYLGRCFYLWDANRQRYFFG